MNLRRALALLVSAGLLGWSAGKPAQGRIEADRYQAEVKYLASDALRGRGTGTPQMEKAARYIADHFKRLGLQPVGGAGYLQRFGVTTRATLAKRGNHLAWSANGTSETAAAFQPFNFSGNGKLSGPVVFAGYGITAPEYDYDDYAGVDVKGKIVLILRHEPQEFDENSKFAGKVYTSHAQMQNKAVNAKFHGARGVLFVNDVPNHPSDPDDLDKFSRTVGPNSPDVPFAQVRGELAGRWLKLAGTDIKSWIAAVDKDLKPRPLEIPGLKVELDVNVERERRNVPNVVGYLKGETDEYVILGAHYDHLGMGEQSSMAPDLAGKAIHPGADDNASGTAGLLELAAYFAGRPPARRGILFVAFAGEELGLLGSSYYVNHPALPLEKAAAMINMDMIGRVKDGRVFIGGVGTGDTLKATLEAARAASRLKFDLSEQGGYGSSDHFSFVTKQVPVLFFFSGLHSDYHKPSDTWDKIDSRSAAEMLDVVAAMTASLQAAPERPKFIKVRTQQPQATASASASGGAWFGSVPDMGENPGGFKLSDVTKGSPADEAGLKGGDLIVEFDGKTISNLYDFTYALRAKKPGDVVRLKYRRAGQEFSSQATLRSRAQRR
jgi:hypothetical protein